MGFKVTFEAEDVEQLKTEVASFAISLGILKLESHTEPVTDKPKRASKKPTQVVETEIVQEKTEAPKEVSHDEAKSLLEKVNTVKGLTTAREILNAVGAKRMSDVKAEQYQEFVALCEKALA